MRRGTRVRRNVARAVFVALVAPTVALLAAAPAGAVTNPPPFLRKWGTLGAGTTQFDSPSGVAIGPDDSVYTIDSVNNRVQQFTPEGVFVRQWDGRGTGRVKFDRPEGITVDADGNVFVSDHKDRILMFTAEGEFIKRIGRTGTARDQLTDPAGLVAADGGILYVVDRGNNRIQRFDVDSGHALHIWGVPGAGNGQFNAPRGIALDGDDHVLVADTGNHRVQVFTLLGAFVRSFGTVGSGPGQFDEPAALATDSEDHVYVADRGNDRVQELSTSGAFLSAWGTTGSARGRFVAPAGVATDSLDDVYVADGGNHRMQEFGPVPQPDARIRVGTSGDFVGDNIHNATGRRQTAAATAAGGRSSTYDVSVQNDGVFAERLLLRGTGSRSGFRVRYSVDGSDVTAAVVAGTQQTPVLTPGEAVTVRVSVNVGASVPVGSSLGAILDATSTLDPARRDVVRFVTSRG